MKGKILGLLAVALLAGPMAANASLLGQMPNCSSDFFTCSPASSLIADPGSEFQLIFFGTPIFDVNISASSILLTQISASAFDPGGTLFTLSGLDGISGVSVQNTSGNQGFTNADLAFNATSISMTLNGIWASGATALIGVDVIPEVPEPGTLALLGLGLAGLGLSRRRKAT